MRLALTSIAKSTENGNGSAGEIEDATLRRNEFAIDDEPLKRVDKRDSIIGTQNCWHLRYFPSLYTVRAWDMGKAAGFGREMPFPLL